MVNINELKRDNEFNQKYALISFAFGKFDTWGLKIHGCFESDEECNDFANRLQNNGEKYFKIHKVYIGAWLPATDDNKKIDSEVYQNEDLSSLMKGMQLNQKKTDSFFSQRKEIIKNNTFIGIPDKQEDIEHLIKTILHSISECDQTSKFYKEVMRKNLERIKNEDYVTETINIVNKSRVKTLSIYDNPSFNQKFCLFTYTDKNFTRQRSKVFSFKVRGGFETMDELYERRNVLQEEDPIFDIFTAPIGKWIAFNDKCNEQSSMDAELLKIINETVCKKEASDKAFEERRLRLRKGKEESIVEESKEDLEMASSNALSLLKKNEEDRMFYMESLNENITKHHEIFKEDISDELKEKIKEVGIEIEYVKKINS